MFRLVTIAKYQRGLWFRRGQFEDLLLPGSTWLLSWQDKIQIVDTRELRFEHPLLDLMLEKPQVRAQLQVVELDTLQRAIVRKDGRLLTILSPGRHGFWKTDAKLSVEILSIDTASRLELGRMEPVDNVEFDISDSLRRAIAARNRN